MRKEENNKDTIKDVEISFANAILNEDRILPTGWKTPMYQREDEEGSTEEVSDGKLKEETTEDKNESATSTSLRSNMILPNGLKSKMSMQIATLDSGEENNKNTTNRNLLLVPP